MSMNNRIIMLVDAQSNEYDSNFIKRMDEEFEWKFM